MNLDVYVLHDGSFRQRVQRTWHGVPVEIFVNPEAAVLNYFEVEARDGRPHTAHMLATGVVIHGDTSDRLSALRAKAREYLETPPSWSNAELTQARYGAATLIEDALDKRSSDPETAMRLLTQAMESTLTYWFKQRGSNIPRAKQVLSYVDLLDPDLGLLVRDFWGARPLEERWSVALALADRVLETRGFFDWESERQDV